MDKKQFIIRLDKALADLPTEEKNKWIDFYDEAINDRMEDGLSETEAVEAVGDVEKLAQQILEQTGAEIKKTEEKPRRQPWKWVLIIGGAPFWLPIALSLAAVVVALLACVYAVEVSMAGSAVGAAMLIPQYLGEGNIPGALMALGCLLFCGGFAILLFKPVLKLTRWVFTGFKRRRKNG